MRVGSDYISVETNVPFQGLFTSLPSTRVNSSFSPRLLNMHLRDGIAIRRPGYLQRGQTLVGKIMRLVEPNILDQGTGELINPLIVLTERRQYKYDDATEEFVDLTPGQEAIEITAVDTGTRTFTVAGDRTADFPVDRPFPVINSDNNDGVYTVESATFGTDTDIVVDEAIPSAAGDLGDINIADDWTQTATDGYIDSVTATDLGSSRLMITNGFDEPRYWDGTDLFEDWTPNYTGFVTCKTFAVHFDHLFMGGVQALTREPSLIAWSDVGNFDEFEDGSSGAQILTDVVGAIRAMKPLGDRLVVYSNDTIITGIFVGLPAVFSFETIISEGTRLTSAKGIVPLDIGHIFPSEENFYLFDGSRGLRPIGNPVKEDYKKNKDFNRLGSASAFNDFSRRTVFLSFRDVADTISTYTMEYDPFDLTQVRWGKEILTHDVNAYGFQTKQGVIKTWQDTTEEANQYPDGMPWDKEIGPWFIESDQLGFPVRVFGTDEGKVYVIDGTASEDAGTAFTSDYETVDFTVPEAFLSHIGRWLEVEFEALGRSVTIAYSLNQGRTFTDLRTVTLTSDFEHYVEDMPEDVSSRTIRLRFRVTNGTFEIRWIRVWTTPGGAR